MNKQQQDDNSQGIVEKIQQIYTKLLPPVQFRSNIEFYDEEKEMMRDCRNYYFGDYQIENIQYQLELDKQQNNKDKNQKNDANSVSYHFIIKNLLPKSQLLEFTAYVKSQYGCKILKTKASNTRMELQLDRESARNQKEQISVFLGQVQGKFKIRLSNYEVLEDYN